MIVDTSALIAILHDEADAPRCRHVMANESTLGLSAASYLEASIVADSTGDPELSRELDMLVEESELAIEPVTAHQARIARVAYQRFGKGSGHPARLNFGECFAYALAQDTGEPLLFVGDDFAQTDVRVAGDSR